MSANWKDKRYRGELIPRGSFTTSKKAFAERCGLSESTVRRCLNQLESTGEITTQTTNKRTRINVLRYAVFQDFDEPKRQTTDRTTDRTNDKQLTGQTTNNSQTTNKRKKERTKERNNIQAQALCDIVSLLNSLTGKNYSVKSKTTAQLVADRMAEGYTLEDFRTVIEKKVAEWTGSKFEQYLTPTTLFGPKFEKYLYQEAKTDVPEYWNPEPIRSEPQQATEEEIERVRKLLKNNTEER